jgi:hypothetical protein
LTGYQYNAYTDNCYSVSTVSGSSSVGAVAGYCSSYSSYSTDCFYNTDIYATSSGGTGKTTSEMKTESTFSDAGWSMGGVWEIDETEATNSGYPYMLWTDYSGDGPLIQAGNISTSSVTSSSMNISWDNGGGDYRAVFMKAASSGTAVPIDNTTYAANTVFESGDQIGTSGWYCIYNGTGTSVTVTNLSEVTEYTIHVCDYYGEAGSEKYRICGNTDNPKTSATLPEASEPTLGDGSQGNPYQISNLSELFWISESTTRWAYHYIQTADIDASSTSLWFDGEGWNPIGNSSTRFTGSYDGGGYTIDGLSMNQPSHDYNGLFGYIYTDAELKNITLTNVDIMADEYTGALVGKMYQSTVSNCMSSGSVEVDYRYVGGLVGWNDEGLIKGSSSSANVIGGTSGYTGGIVGYNDYGTIQDAFSTGAVSGVYDYTGGLVGHNYYGIIQVCYSTGSVSSTDVYTGGIAGKSERGTIRYSYSTSNVDGGSNNYTGGLVGYNYYGKIDKCYYDNGTITSTGNYTGGLVGQNYYNTGDLGYVTDCYSTGTVNGSGYVGGIVGYQYSSYTDNCYSVASLSGSSSIGGVAGYCSSSSTYSTDCFFNTDIYSSSSGGTGKTTAEMKTESTFSDAGWDIGVVWLLDGTHTVNNGYPYLAWSEYSGTAPLIQASNIVATNLTGESMTLTWANGNGDYRAVFIKETNSGTAVPANNTSYTANTEFGSGDQIGTTGWYCVYNGTENTVDITGLDEITEYTVFVSEYFGESGSEDYRLCENTDNPKTIATPPLSTQPAGSGTAADPYQIASLANLYWITEDDTRWDKFYLQTANIDASATSSWFSGEGWIPIGENYNEFTGFYDGQNYDINNLTINRPSTNYVGMFGSIEEAYVGRINISSASVIGAEYTGIVVGKSYRASIGLCHVDGSVTGTNNVGGVVGNTYYSTISNSSSMASVEGTGENTGGITGYVYWSNLKNSFAGGSVIGNDHVGGLVGEFDRGNTEISNCYSYGTVDGSSSIGGLIGYHYTDCYLDHSYSFASVSGTGSTGGLTGYSHHGDNFVDAGFYNTDIISTSESGTGYTTAELKTQSVFTDAGFDFVSETENGNKDIWNIDAGFNNAYPYLVWQDETGTEPRAQALEIVFTTTQTNALDISWTIGSGESRVVFMKEADSGFAEPVDNSSYAANSSFGNGSEIGTSGWYCVYNGTGSQVSVSNLTSNTGYIVQVLEYNGNPGSEDYNINTAFENPSLKYTHPIEPIEPAGSGDSNDPYIITSLNNLYYLSLHPGLYGWDYFEQVNDIDASSTATWFDGKGFIPIGSGEANKNKFYIEEYDGQGYKITGLHINRPELNYVAFIGCCGHITDIHDLGLENIYVVGNNMTAALLGQNPYDGCYIYNCYSTGVVKSDGYYVGGLIGKNYQGGIRYCYSECDVMLNDPESTESEGMGGFIGHFASSSYGGYLYECYATGNVSGYEEVGGFVGKLEDYMHNCYATGDVSGSEYVGGFSGYGNWSSSSASACYATGRVSSDGQYVGGFTGQMSNDYADNCIWNVDTDGIHDNNFSGADNHDATGKTTTEMLLQSTYEAYGFDFGSKWAIDPNYNDGYPYLQVFSSPEESDVYTWLGTACCDWCVANNWDQNEVPTSTDRVNIKAGINDLDICSNYQCQSLALLESAPIILHDTVIVNKCLALNNDMDLNGQVIILSEDGFISETEGRAFGSTGCIKTTRTLNNIDENIAGFGLELTTSQNMGETTIERTHKGILGEENDGVLRVFKISPNNNSGLNATMVFHYYESELNGNDENTLVLYKSSDEGQTWVEVGGTVDTDENTVTLSGIDGFSWWTLAKAGETLLPVEFLSFSGAYITKNQVQLNWKTATEKNNSHFIIERSVDALNFTRIDKVEGAGNSVSEKQYKYIDRNATASGYYYRIKQVDMDGKYSYTGTIWVSQNDNNLIQIKAYPNPFMDNISIVVSGANQSLEIEIIDVKGNTIYSNSTSNNEKNIIQTKSWQPGLYVLKCSTNGKSYYQKIIKK